jgi:rod shape-determining protein MreC
LIRLSPQLRAAVERGSLPLLVFASVAIIMVGKADQRIFDSLRVAFGDAAAPVLDAVSRPLTVAGNVIDHARDIVAMYQENTRLREENARLLQWQQAARRLASENQELRGLLKLVPEPGASYVTARVIANSGGAYVRTVMINAGSAEGLARGQAAITGDGLVGRLTEVGDRAARVLLITDLNSRIPVMIDGSHDNAVLAGDNSERPRLLYLPTGASVKSGDRIVTSGEGGLFPPGLPIGVVVSLDGAVPRVEPYAELSQVSYLRIVNYGLAAALPRPVSQAPHPRRHARARAGDGSSWR